MYRNSQRGMSFFGVVALIVVVGFVAMTGLKLFPMYQGYYTIKQSGKSLAGEPGVADMDATKIRTLMMKRLDISFNESIKKEDIQLDRIDGGWNMLIEWDETKPWVGNIDLVGHFKVEQKLVKGGEPTGE